MTLEMELKAQIKLEPNTNYWLPDRAEYQISMSFGYPGMRRSSEKYFHSSKTPDWTEHPSGTTYHNDTNDFLSLKFKYTSSNQNYSWTSVVDKGWFNNVIVRTLPLKTLCTINPTMTSFVLYLIHDSSVYVTGSFFIIDSSTILASTPVFSSL
ncbi:hypothetical protein OSB04_012520 [Centaurea solstitialis]|uniref:Uncharacterized protein n=1 Tax=Centaurea solstitialis TaxID=347529 RepID=A0AA38TM57_9ASTR|nr:hypothetical protein OSB04_012520 [Centaurea solstitialis]